MRACFPSLSRISHSGCSCAIFDTMYLCDSHLPWPSSTPRGSHHSCTRIPCLWKSSVIFLMESPGKVSGARIPVAVGVEPAIVERRPLDAKFFQLRDRAQHLRRSDVEFVTPAAPAHVVSFARRLGNLPSFFLQHARPQVQRLVKIAGVHGNKTARRGICFSRLERGVGGNVHAGVDAAVVPP